MKWWYWMVAGIVWAFASLVVIIAVIQPAIQSSDLRIIVGLVGGLVCGWIGSQMLMIGWYSR